MKINYNTSTDYGKLYGLLKEGLEIVCFVRSGSWRNSEWVKDSWKSIALARIRDDRFILGTPGIGYEKRSKPTKEEFIKDCAEQELEFIEPND